MAAKKSSEKIEDKITEEEKLLWPLWVTGFGTALIIAAFLFKFYDADFSGKPEDWEIFSGYLGGLTSPLIAFAVLIYVYNTFEVQRKELNETKRALEASRKEQEKQTKIQKIESLIRIKQHAAQLFGDHSKIANLEIEKTKKEIEEVKTSRTQYTDNEKIYENYLKSLDHYLATMKKHFSDAEKNADELNTEILSYMEEIDKI
ncbi:MAG: hypothetical protein R3D86_13295 [Emcibacteraceae bacterium]